MTQSCRKRSVTRSGKGKAADGRLTLVALPAYEQRHYKAYYTCVFLYTDIEGSSPEYLFRVIRNVFIKHMHVYVCVEIFFSLFSRENGRDVSALRSKVITYNEVWMHNAKLVEVKRGAHG